MKIAYYRCLTRTPLFIPSHHANDHVGAYLELIIITVASRLCPGAGCPVRSARKLSTRNSYLHTVLPSPQERPQERTTLNSQNKDLLYLVIITLSSPVASSFLPSHHFPPAQRDHGANSCGFCTVFARASLDANEMLTFLVQNFSPTSTTPRSRRERAGAP